MILILDYHLDFYSSHVGYITACFLLVSEVQSTLYSIYVLFIYIRICACSVSIRYFKSKFNDANFSDDHQNVVYRPIRTMVAKQGQLLCLPDADGNLKARSLRYFTYRKLTYLWHPSENRFITIQEMESNVKFFERIV